MNCHLLGHLWVPDEDTGSTKCAYCGTREKTDPLSGSEKALVMLVLCGVFSWIAWNADEIAVWIWGIML